MKMRTQDRMLRQLLSDLRDGKHHVRMDVGRHHQGYGLLRAACSRAQPPSLLLDDQGSPTAVQHSRYALDHYTRDTSAAKDLRH